MGTPIACRAEILGSIHLSLEPTCSALAQNGNKRCPYKNDRQLARPLAALTGVLRICAKASEGYYAPCMANGGGAA